jgi:hypothetical protein
MHGSHHDAQKFTMTGLPAYWLSEIFMAESPRTATVKLGAAASWWDVLADEPLLAVTLIAAIATMNAAVIATASL